MIEPDPNELHFAYDSEAPQGETPLEVIDGWNTLVLGTKKPTPKVSRLRRLKNWIKR